MSIFQSTSIIPFNNQPIIISEKNKEYNVNSTLNDNIKKLPISSSLPIIIDFINKYDKCAIIAPVGVGKSIALPAALCRNTSNTLKNKVYVSMPSFSMIKAIKQSQTIFNRNLNVSIMGDIDESTINDDIVYGTSYAIRNKILSTIKNGIYNPIDFCDYLIIDEIHVGNSDNYLILGLIENFRAHNVKVPKVIITSATLDISKYPDFPLLTIDEKSQHVVDVKYHNIEYKENDKTRYLNIAQYIVDAHEKDKDLSGSYLVFLPGKNEITTVANVINQLVNDSTTIDLILVHSDARKNTFDKLYSTNINNVRKIILATNILETTITIENVSLVVDSMLEKKINEFLGNQLITEYISKSSAEQRKGRTGRTRPGICYRFIPKQEYEKLPNQKKEEIYVVKLHHIIMDIINVDISPIGLLPKDFNNKIYETLLELVKLGLIQRGQNINSYNITPMGKMYSHFHLLPEPYVVLWKLLEVTTGSSTNNYIFPGIVIISMLENNNKPLINIEIESTLDNSLSYFTQQKEYKNKYYGKFIGRSDLHTYFNIWKDFYHHSGKSIPSSMFIDEWSDITKINSKQVKKILSTTNIILNKLSTLGYVINIPDNIDNINTNKFIDFLRPIIRFVYSNHIFILDKNSKGSAIYIEKDITNSNNTKFFPAKIPGLNTYESDPPSMLIAFNIATFKNKKIIKFSLNIDPININDRFVISAESLIGYQIKMPIWNRRLNSIKSLVDNYPTIIDTSNSNPVFGDYPKTIEEGFIPIGHPFKILSQ